MLVLLLSVNASADNNLNLPPLRDFVGFWINPLAITFTRVADKSFTLKLISSATASQAKLTVELIVVLTDWGWFVISVK